MAHLWLEIVDEWTPVPLDGEAFALDATGAAPVTAVRGDATPPAILRRSGEGLETIWCLVTPDPSSVLVNGRPAALGLVVLADRDAIRIGGGPPMFFSTETLAAIDTCPAEAARGFCPRCQQALQAGAPAVRCPGCGLWYHEALDLPCWTYAERCAACARPTPLDGRFTWTPQDV